MPRGLLVALQFLTRLPLRVEPAPSATELGQSLLWYPLVGALLGLLLVVAVIPALPLPLHAALLLGLWVIASGALHLDGLADCADAWIGGHGDRERTLAIMKDTHAGSMAVVAIVVVLLSKFAALLALLEQGAGWTLWLAPLLARAAMPALFASTPYVRSQGLGSALAEQLPRNMAWIVVSLALASTAAAGIDGVFAALCAVAAFALLRRAFMRRLGGFTGDCAGAAVELTELTVLVALAV